MDNKNICKICGKEKESKIADVGRKIAMSMVADIKDGQTSEVSSKTFVKSSGEGGMDQN